MWHVYKAELLCPKYRQCGIIFETAQEVDVVTLEH